MSNNTAVVNELMEAWQHMDVERIMAVFDDDSVYTNVPIDPPNVGKAAIRATVESFLGMAQGVDFVVHHSAENPLTGVVLNERTDRFLMNGKWVQAGVVGVFEVRDGKIRAWRDYFDLAQFQRAMAGT